MGVRTEIVRDLTAALSQADLKATVDGNTGDIMLESAVFFDVAKSNIKDSGRALLDEFIPVYLGVLLQPEYVDYLGEIIIEGIPTRRVPTWSTSNCPRSARSAWPPTACKCRP